MVLKLIAASTHLDANTFWVVMAESDNPGFAHVVPHLIVEMRNDVRKSRIAAFSDDDAKSNRVEVSWPVSVSRPSAVRPADEWVVSPQTAPNAPADGPLMTRPSATSVPGVCVSIRMREGGSRTTVDACCCNLCTGPTNVPTDVPTNS